MAGEYQDAEWAIEPIRRLNSEFFQKGWKHPDPVRNGDNLKNLMWLGVIDERQANGKDNGIPHTRKLASHRVFIRSLARLANGIRVQLGEKFSLNYGSGRYELADETFDAIVANVPEDADFVLLTNFTKLLRCAQPDVKQVFVINKATRIQS